MSISSGLARMGLVGADWIVIRYGAHFHASGDDARFRKTLHFALLLSGSALLLVAGGLLAVAPVLASEIFHTPGLTPLLRLAAIVVPISGIGFVMLYGTKALHSLREEAVVTNILRPIARILFVGVALVIATSELSAFVGLTVAEITITLGSILALSRRLSIMGRTEAIDYRSIVRFALPAWGTRIAENLRRQLFPIMLAALASLSATGIFVMTQRIALALAVLIATIEQIYSPMAPPFSWATAIRSWRCCSNPWRR